MLWCRSLNPIIVQGPVHRRRLCSRAQGDGGATAKKKKKVVVVGSGCNNGINHYDTDKPPRYVDNTHLSSRIGRLNLDWTDPDQSQEKENEAFQRAMDLAGKEFLESVRFHARSCLSMARTALIR